MNLFQLVYAYIKKNLKIAQETEDSMKEENNGSK